MNRLRSGIYSINSLSGKRYIGSAIDITRRLDRHFCDLRNNIHKNPHLQRAWKKYDSNAFNSQVVLYCDIDDLLFYEQRVINYYKDNGGLFNICLIAGSNLGCKMSDEHKAKLRSRLMGNSFTLGHKLSDEHKLKISIGNKGKSRRKGYYHHSLESRAKIGLASKGNKYSVGVIQSEETRAKRSKTLKGRIMSEEAKCKISSTLQGHFVSDETRIRQSESHIGKPSPKKGIPTKPHSEEHNMKIAESMRFYRRKLQEAVSK